MDELSWADFILWLESRYPSRAAVEDQQVTGLVVLRQPGALIVRVSLDGGPRMVSVPGASWQQFAVGQTVILSRIGIETVGLKGRVGTGSQLTPADEGGAFVPAPAGDAVQPPLLPLVVSRDSINPTLALLPRAAPVWGPPYLPEAAPLQEHPPVRLLGTASATPAGTEPLARQEHMRVRDRDPLMPYSAGIKDGQVYVRVFDLPAWGHFLRRNDATNWPDDGANLWAYDPDVPALFMANAEASVVQPYAEADTNSPYPNDFFQQSVEGRPLYFNISRLIDLIRAPWRTVYGASGASVQAAVTRHYLNGNTEIEPPLPCVEITVDLPPFTPLTLHTSYNSPQTNFGYQVDATITRAPIPGISLGSQGLYGLWKMTTTPSAAPLRPDDRLMVETVFGRDFKAFVLPGPYFFRPAGYDAAFSPATVTRPLKLRYPALANGNPTATPGAALTLSGRLVYEGPLGILPAPYSGVTGVWCGLSVTAAGAFSADAWMDREARWAVVLHASGLLQISRQQGTTAAQVWTLSAADLGALSLPVGTPILSYSFLQEGRGWPGTAGLLVWSSGVTLTARARRGPDPRDGTCPLVFRPGPQALVLPDASISLLAGFIPAAPVAASVTPERPGDPLPAWQAPAPGEPEGRKPQLVSVTGTLQLTFPDGGAGVRARLRRLLFLTTRSAAAALGAHLTVPPGWTVITESRPGRTALVVLTPPGLIPLTVSLTCTALPFAAPRAHLEATPDAQN